MHYLIIPGIDGSGEDHWQSLWQARWGAAATRIAPASWSEPDLEDWCRAIDRAAEGAVLLVAHSLGCLAAAHWAARRPGAAAGLFLVAPPDPAGPAFPAAAAPTFVPFVPSPPGVPGLVVHSDDDPYCTPEAARRLAAGWELPALSVGPAGHVNAASGLGAWEAGRALLTAFAAGVRTPVRR
ncbi:alpha/beta hydrolase [Actinomadura sp. ATCC 31491]|uniref:Alpha/beta hydrolase n=1 Tax=Actinomadura luzonensis TaxID=2805427 RepID=A0ABT0G8L9_9ACTN|nr:alpha/beta hydrolase [Actinomadura luzonensis]MCK2220943.1 alpha/beta hydrolase [Actinomadura luzonensis]